MMLVMMAVDGLSRAERRVWEAFPRGEVVDFQAGDSQADDPLRGGSWGRKRQVRGEVLAALLFGAAPVESGHVARIFLRGARIIGAIHLRDADLKSPMWLDSCHLEDGVDFSNAIIRILGLPGCYLGHTDFTNAKVGTLLDLGGAHLDGNGEPALNGYRLTVGGDMFCEEGFRADGRIGLAGAAIGGHLRCNGAQLNGNGGPALTADALHVTGSLLLDGPFRAYGEIRLTGASIGGHFSCSGAQLDGNGGPALTADRLSIADAMFCNEGFHAEGKVSLFRSNLRILVDDIDSWPLWLELRGFTYGDLDPHLPAYKRLEWLSRCSEYGAQPYEQLAAYYRRLGYDRQARRVLLAGQRARRQQRPWWTRWWGWLQDAVVGYGYAPGRALALLAVAFFSGWVLFRTYPPPPVNPRVHPSFNAALYTLDLLVPAPGLGQAGAWNPHGQMLAVAAGLRSMGWLLAITLTAAITRTLIRN
jgi:hypothetical protein